MSAYGADMTERPNRGKLLYAPAWEDEMADLANSCASGKASIGKAECRVLMGLYETPHAYVVGTNSPLGYELQELHAIILDALGQGKVPTIILYSFPDRDCGGGVPNDKKITAAGYKMWIDRISNAIRHYRGLPINIIIEPGGLANIVVEAYKLCNERKRSDILAERIKLIQYASWSFALVDRRGKRINPNARLFVDVGNPDRIAGAKEKLAIANALEKVLEGADIDGISVSGASEHSFDESVAWAKQLIEGIRLKVRKKLTIAIDVGRSGNKVEGSCSAKGIALDTLSPTLDHPDPRVELVIIMSVPGETYGDGRDCGHNDPLDNFDLQAFLEFLRNTTANRASTGN